MRVLGHLGRHIVADLGVQARHQHERLLHDAGNLLLVSREAVHQVLLKRPHAVRQQTNRVQEVADDQRLVHVQFELAVHAADGGRHVVAHHLRAHHRQGLGLGRVDLAGHDGRAGLVLRQVELAETAAGAGAEVADVLGDLGQGGGEGVERAVGVDEGVVSGESLELVGGRLELGASHLGDFLGDGLGEALEGVDAGADGGTALGEQTEVRERVLNALDAKVELGDVAGELLGKGERGGVLQVGAADLDDLLGLELVDLGLESGAEGLESGQELALDLEHGGNVHDGGEGVVGGSGAVDVVVGVHGLLGAHGAAEDLNGAVGDDLVGVHVGLGAGTGLPDDEGEVVEELEVGNLLGGLLDGLADLGVCLFAKEGSGQLSAHSFHSSSGACPRGNR